MEVFKNPWKSSLISDPILSLSNLQLQKCQRKESNQDRYCSESFNKNLFHFEKQSATNTYKAPIAINSTEESDKNYRGLLAKTCTLQSKPTTPDNTFSVFNYISKINRSGYVLNTNLHDFPTSSLSTRNIPKQPYRILNAPKLNDDFYKNLLDWSSEDLISVVLDRALYIWNSKQSQTEKLIEGFISSIKWGKGLAIGEQTGQLRIIDVHKRKQIGKHRAHNSRIGTIDCMGNLVLTGSKDCQIFIWDIRSKNITSKLDSHKKEVCGVRWSIDGSMIASGDNNNMVEIWDVRGNKNLCKFKEHVAAVKALAWSPHQNNILSTGGGTSDKSIRVWNIHQQKCIKTIHTGSQVCNMMYSINSNELVSTHGLSMNGINIWNGKNMQKIGMLRGHANRVLFLARSPDGESILTGSGDQTLRFWKIFPSSSGSAYNRVTLLQPKNNYLR